MTVCNMTIEGGGRAGMIAPDETTFEWVRRPARRAPQRGPGRRGARCAPTTARASTARSSSTPPRSARWSPGAPTRGWSSASPTRVPDAGAGRRRTSARCTTWASRPARRSRRSSSTASSSAPAPTRGSATCAPPPRCRRAQGRRRRLRDGRARARRRSRRRPRREGLDEVFRARRLRLARRGLLDVPGHEPRHRCAGRAGRVDLEPQLRGPPGPRRALAPGLARRWPPRRRSRAISSTSGTGS